MAILRSQDGRFFQIDDNELEKYQVKPEDLPAGQNPPPPGPRGPGGPSGPGMNLGGNKPIQLIFNLGGGGVPMPPPGGRQMAGAGAGSDVEAHGYCGWNNWSNWSNWNNYCG
jgi:hypothetical protein